MTVNHMINAICRRICIRSIWHCKAGWGMQFVLMRELHPDLISRAMDEEEVTYAYYPTLEACVKGEYNYWVLIKNEKMHPKHKRPK